MNQELTERGDKEKQKHNEKSFFFLFALSSPLMADDTAGRQAAMEMIRVER